MTRRSVPVPVKIAAFVSALGIAALGVQVLGGVPPARQQSSVAALDAVHPALIGSPSTAPKTATPPDKAPIVAYWQRYRLQGVDSRGRSVFALMLVLSTDYQWTEGSTATVTHLGEDLPLSALPGRNALHQALGESRVIVALGSDEETREGGTLSTERARNLAAWARRTVSGPRHPLGLDLGRYRPAKPAAPERVRRVVLMGIPVLDGGADLTEALRDALASSDVVPMEVRLYSKFELIEAD